MFAVLFKVPWIEVVVEFASTEVITGKFCLLFDPLSPSQSSFAINPPRSIPKPPFEKIELPRMAFPVSPPVTAA